MKPEQDKDVRELNRLFKRYHTARKPWYNRGIENEELVYSDREGTGTQFKASQIRKAQEDRAIPITVNILSAIKEQIQAFLTAFKPALSCIPVGASSKSFSYVWREVCLCLWHLNVTSRELDAAIGDSITVGNGYLRLKPTNFYVSNEFNVVIEYTPWQYVYLDPDSKRQDLKDHEAVILATPYTAQKAKNMYQLTDEEIAFCSVDVDKDGVTVPIGDKTAFTGTEDKPIWLQEFFIKTKKMVYYLADGTTTFEKPAESKMSVGPEGLSNTEVVAEQPRVVIRYVLKVGDYIKQEQFLPCEEYPIIKLGCKWNKKPYDYPVMHDIVDLQKAFNSFLAITILNAQYTSNGGYIAPEGSIDKAQFKQDISTPGSVAEYDADPQLPNAGQPIPRTVQPLNNAWYTLMSQIIYFVEYVTGIYGVVQGNPQNTPNTLGATNSLQDFGTQRIKRHARHIDYALNDLFDVLIPFVQHYGKKDAIATYINNTDAMVQIRMNVTGQVDASGQFTEQEQGQEKAALIEDMASGQVRAILGDFNVGKYHTRFQNASDIPSTRAMALSIIKDLMSHMSSPEIATVVAEQALELLDIPQADNILNKVQIVNKMQEQLGQMQEQIGKLAKDNEKLTEEIFDREKEIKLLQFDKDLNKTKVKLETLTKEQEDETKKLEKQQEAKKKTIY